MDLALETLVYGLGEARFSEGGRVLFLNARAHASIAGDVTAVQWFKPYYDVFGQLANNTCGVASRRVEQYTRVEDVSGVYDAAYLLFPKNMIEGRYLLAKALTLVKREGAVFVSAENKAGGTRLQKIAQQFGCEIVQQFSKHKCRVVQLKNCDVKVDVIDAALCDGSMKIIDKTGFAAQAGVYGWDKIDRGSEILLQHIADDLKGVVADFGCGYGYLLQHILQHNQGIKTAYGIDADARALESARQNIGDARAEYLWADLTTAEGIPAKLDAIVMNPPFHEGKRTDSDIGAAFICNAAASLKRNGALYMVANNQLPYEAVLEDAFFSFEILAQTGGFKVFKAVV